MAGIARSLRLGRKLILNTARRTLSTEASARVSGGSGAGPLAEFPGASVPYASRLAFVSGESYEPLAAYRVLDASGARVADSTAPLPDRDVLIRMYTTMIQLREMDKILYESQRQGRISFYMTNSGEEGIHAGSAAALAADDLVFAQYREVGLLLYRGHAVRDLVHQCYGNVADPARGRQMPVHYGNKDLHFVTISSPLATQMPQAVGAAYAYKRVPGNRRVVACFFGDGAASEGDAHAAFNFAATLQCPILFLCRNNGFAISTPTSEQYAGDGIAAHGPAYGIRTARVDGTDPLAVFHVVGEARQYALRHNKPVLVEAMAYRVGHHSTSDDSSAYRPAQEAARWTEQESAINKLRLYLQTQGMWSDEQEAVAGKAARTAVLQAMLEAEKLPKPAWREMFEDVYSDMPPHILKQMRGLQTHLDKYAQHYPLDQYHK